MSRYPEVPGFKGSSGTGQEAADYYAAQAQGRKGQVLAGLEALGGTATCEEISVEIGLHWYLCRPRISECKALGLVIETGERGAGALGGRVNQWRLTTPDERSLFFARAAAEFEKAGAQ